MAADSTADVQHLVDKTAFVLNSAERIVLHVGFDPNDNFNVAIHIITPLNDVSMSVQRLKRLFRPKKSPLDDHDDDYGGVSYRTARGGADEMMYVENRNREGSGRPLVLYRPELRALWNAERSLFCSIRQKRTVVRDRRRLPFEKLLEFLESKLERKRISCANFDDVLDYVSHIRDDKILKLFPESEWSFISKIIPLACVRASELWMNPIDSARNDLAELVVFPES